jgi:hypothetical protein
MLSAEFSYCYAECHKFLCMLNDVMLSAEFSPCYDECRYAECRVFLFHAECRYDECRHAECRGAEFLNRK